MNERETWNIIGTNIEKFTPLMVTIPKGSWVDVYADPSGKRFSFSHPDGDANIKLFSMTCPDLERSYDIQKKGDLYFYSDEEEGIPAAKLPEVLAQYIRGMKDGGAEWGWEFKF